MQEAIIKNADQMIARMTEVEKIRVRGATPEALEYMRISQFLSDGPSHGTMTKVKARLDAEYTTAFDAKWWDTQTWMF